MGVAKETLDVYAYWKRQLYEQSYQMLQGWQKQNGGPQPCHGDGMQLMCVARNINVYS